MDLEARIATQAEKTLRLMKLLRPDLYHAEPSVWSLFRFVLWAIGQNMRHGWQRLRARTRLRWQAFRSRWKRP